jgi:dTDP-4-dehydrorhamnose reductase
MQKKSLLATGAIGLVGSRFLELYHDAYEVHNIDVLSGVDITDRAQVAAFMDAHPAAAMLHLAAFTDTARAQAEAGDKNGLCYRVNVVGTQNIASLCEERGIYLIHISTDFVFDGTKESPYVETDVPSPLDWYGTTKAEAERVVRDSGARAAIVRLSYPYRAVNEKKPDIIRKLRDGLESGSLSPQFDDTLITPTFIDDIARGFARLIEQKAEGTFHFVGSTALSPYTLAQKVAALYGFDPKVVQPGSLTRYLSEHDRPFARYGALSNTATCATLDLAFADIDSGLATLREQQGGEST